MQRPYTEMRSRRLYNCNLIKTGPAQLGSSPARVCKVPHYMYVHMYC